MFLSVQVRRSDQAVSIGPPSSGQPNDGLCDFIVQSLVPMSAVVMLYCHVYYSLKKLPISRDHQLKKITLVALVSCSALIVGWIPGRILSKYGITQLTQVHGKLNSACVTIEFLNSCLNLVCMT